MRRFAPDSYPPLLCLSLVLVSAILIACGIMMIVLPEPVLASSSDLTAAVNQYPQIENTDLDSCSLCHGNGSSLNPYGSDYDTDGFIAIENIDSDGDGFLNIDEINILTEPGDASDYPHDDVLALIKYPTIAGTSLDSCDLCHGSGISLNPYGVDYRDSGRNLAAFDLIESIDSDGDSFSNIAEINELTFPGDDGDHPVVENEDLTRARETYPALTGTQLDSCNLCHTTGSALNNYGQAYFDNGRNSAAFGLIESNDSDGDDFTNLEEITQLTFPGNAGDPHDNALAIKKYPALFESRLDTCTLCHTDSSGTALNPYGTDYHSNGRNLAAFGLIETIDSDGDSFTNLEEITELTFPGNASDSPTVQHNHENLIIQQYPTIDGTRLAVPDTCDMCHNADLTLNGYGADYANTTPPYDFAVIESGDSDGDDFTNLEEILQLTFPGDDDDPHDNALALKKYPALDGTRLDTCILCHTDSSATGLNPYGVDYRDGGRDLAAFDLIENLDSDEDIYSNIDEIEQLTFPGYASDMPGAEHNYETLLIQQYPTINGTRLTTPDTCDVCHNAGETTLNAYGSDYATDFDFVAIENIDSDNDGFVNIDEIDLFFYPGNLDDRPDSDMPLFRSVYPAFHGSDEDVCHMCHSDETGPPDLNPYGEDYLSYGRSRAALVAIENLDSDGDGYFNLEELELGYCPGESYCPTHSESLLIKYPYLEGTRLDSCDLCHDYSAPGDWRYYFNSYGEAYIDAGGNGTAFDIIEELDSDGDGHLNLKEIEALSMPGDPTDVPVQSGGTNFVFLPVILK